MRRYCLGMDVNQNGQVAQQNPATNNGPTEPAPTTVLLEQTPGIIRLLMATAKSPALSEVDKKRLKSASNALRLVSNGLQQEAIRAL